METVLIQIKNKKAYKLLKDLEDLHIIKLIKKGNSGKQKLSDKYHGSLPGKVADELQEYVSQSRSEWDKNSI
jgi:hypothetical protein